MEMAKGYAIEAETANSFEYNKRRLKQWPYSNALFLTHPGDKREAPEAGEVFVQKDLLETLSKMVEAEQEALKHHGKTRKEAIYAAYDRFYKGRHRPRVCAGLSGTGRADYHGGPGRLEAGH